MRESGIQVVKVGVGDKFVVEEMRKSGFNLGGESSGHIIFLDHTTTGDGCIAALNVLSVMRESGKSLSELNSLIVDVPQVLVNCRVSRRDKLDDIPGYSTLVNGISAKLNGEGRVFVRFSGTEPLVRVMVEGPDRNSIAAYADEIGQFLQKALS